MMSGISQNELLKNHQRGVRKSFRNCQYRSSLFRSKSGGSEQHAMVNMTFQLRNKFQLSITLQISIHGEVQNILKNVLTTNCQEEKYGERLAETWHCSSCSP